MEEDFIGQYCSCSLDSDKSLKKNNNEGDRIAMYQSIELTIWKVENGWHITEENGARRDWVAKDFNTYDGVGHIVAKICREMELEASQNADRQ